MFQCVVNEKKTQLFTSHQSLNGKTPVLPAVSCGSVGDGQVLLRFRLRGLTPLVLGPDFGFVQVRRTKSFEATKIRDLDINFERSREFL